MESSLKRQVGGDHYLECEIQPVEYIYRNKHINFRTSAARDKCIEEIKAIIEKYSKK